MRIAKLFPLFVLGFLAMAIVRSIGDARLAPAAAPGESGTPRAGSGVAKTVGETWGTAALGTAMAGVGLSTNLRALRRLGGKPFSVGALSAALVAGLALLLAALVGPRL